MDETWKPVPDFEHYEVSNLGRARNSAGRIMSGMKLKNSRILLRLMEEKDGRPWQERQNCMYLHRAILRAFVGEPQKGYEGCHRDDNPANNNLENLYWGTRKQNISDRIRNGKHFFNKKIIGCGEKNGAYKLSDDQVECIRKEYIPVRGIMKELAKRYGVTPSNISYIIRNKSRISSARAA